MANDPIVDLKLNLDVSGVNNALYDLIGNFKGTDKQFAAISASIDKNAKILEASIKRFGPASREAASASNTLQKSLTSLAAYGVNPLSNDFKKLESSLPQVAKSIETADNNLKKSNMQWTNLALVVQDLPYGFRGIQNNLPALMGGFAALTGPIYLLGSVIIALFTAWDQGSFKAAGAIDRVTEAHKNKLRVVEKGAQAEGEAVIEMEKLSNIFLGVASNSITAEDALYQYNKQVGSTWGVAKSLNEAEDEFINKSTAYIKAAAIRAQADESYALAIEAFKEGRTAAGKDQVSFLKKLSMAGGALDAVGIMGGDPSSVAKFVKGFFTNLALAQKQGTEKVIAESDVNFKKYIEKGREYTKEYQDILKAAGIKPEEGEKPKTGKTAEQLQREEDQRLIAGTKALEDITLSLLDERGQKESKARMQLRDRTIALEEAGFSDFTNAYAAYEKELAEIRKFYDDKELKERQEINDKLYAAQIAESDRLLQNRLDVLAIESQVRAKLNRKQPNMVVEGYKEDLQALYRELNQTIVEGGTAKQIEKIEDAIVKMKGTIEGSTPTVQNFAVTWLETTNKINKALADLAVNSAISIGESLGKALAGEDVDAFGALGEVLATALTQIGQALIAFAILEGAALESLKDPTKWPVALAAGIAAVAAGAFLKSKLNSKKDTKVAATPFANGGIISGPTLGLMGEYPGAKTNPEVVAPLDKLKDMIGGQGGGSGMFVLRGQDLLLSVNRAQKASTLKGQNISLG